MNLISFESIFAEFQAIRIFRTMFAAGFLLIITAAGYADAIQAEDSQILVIVNEDTVITSDLEKEIVKTHSSMGTDKRSDYDYRKLVDKLVNDHLIRQEAKSLGMDEEDWVVKYLNKRENEAAINIYFKDKFHPDLSVSEKKILEHFNKNYSQIQIRTISIATFEEANKIRQDIINGASMDSVAQAVSLDMYRFRGGLHKMKFWADIEDVHRKESLKLKEKEISQPFKYREVYAIMEVESKLPPDTAAYLEKFRKGITATLARMQQKVQWDKFIDSLENIYPVQIDSMAIAGIIADTVLIHGKDFLKDAQLPVLTSVDGRIVTDGDLRRKLSHSSMTISSKTVGEVFDDVVKESREDLILSAVVKAENYFSDSRVLKATDKVLDSLLVDNYLKETIVPKIVFNKAEFEEYYQENKENFRRPTEYRLGQINLVDEETSELVESQLNDGSNFDFLARQYNKDYDCDETLKEWITLESFPDKYSNEIAQLKVGQSTRAFPTAEGFIIFNVKATRPGDVLPLDEVEMKIREVMFQRKFNEILDETLDILKSNSNIKYNDEVLENYFSE